MRRHRLLAVPAPAAVLTGLTLATAGLLWATVARAGIVAGPLYWRWGTWELPIARTGLLLLPPLVALIAVDLLRQRGSVSTRRCLVLLAGIAFVAMLLVLGAPYDPFSLEKIRYIVEDPGATSYFTAALGVEDAGGALANYPEAMEGFVLHARTKPAGPVLYYRWLLDLFGRAAASTVGGLWLGVLAALSIPATFGLSRTLGSTSDEAFGAASLMTLTPGLLFFFPSFDAVYTLATCAIVAGWVLALRDDRPRWAALSGLALAAALFVAFNHLVLGACLALYAGYRARREPLRVARHAAVLLLTVVSGYVALHVATGYDAIAVFRAALANQHELGVHLERPYPTTIPWDLSDFALGAGWLTVLLALGAAVRAGLARRLFDERAVWLWIAPAQPVVTALTGLLAAETARVWLLFTPLIAFAAGRELARLPAWARWAVFGLAWILLVALRTHHYFVAAGPRPI